MFSSTSNNQSIFHSTSASSSRPAPSYFSNPHSSNYMNHAEAALTADLYHMLKYAPSEKDEDYSDDSIPPITIDPPKENGRYRFALPPFDGEQYIIPSKTSIYGKHVLRRVPRSNFDEPQDPFLSTTEAAEPTPTYAAGAQSFLPGSVSTLKRPGQVRTSRFDEKVKIRDDPSMMSILVLDTSGVQFDTFAKAKKEEIPAWLRRADS